MYHEVRMVWYFNFNGDDIMIFFGLFISTCEVPWNRLVEYGDLAPYFPPHPALPPGYRPIRIVQEMAAECGLGERALML
jgi:hypothetical protein